MGRLPRLFIPGLPQLITQRGNNRAPVFLDEGDYQLYLMSLREAARESGVAVHAYVLMPDHAHLLVSAPDEAASGNFMQRLGRRYVRGFNDRHQRSGTLWEGRYRSTVLDPGPWLLPVCLYLEQNPVRTGLVAQAALYPWSSCAHHLGTRQDPLLTAHAAYWSLGNTPFDRQAAYRRLLEAGLGSLQLEAIRYAAHRGWMLGELPAARPDLAPNRRISPLPKGRPRKARSAEPGGN